MSESGAPINLREAGVGVVLGGIVLIVLAEGIAHEVGAAATLVIGIGYAVIGPDILDKRRIGLGVVLVGIIALVETSRFGIGFEPLVIGLFAIAFGMFDIVLGLVFTRVQDRRNREA